MFVFIYLFTKFSDIFTTKLIEEFDTKKILNWFYTNNFFVKGFEYMGLGHFRIKKTKRGKTYYNRCNCLPKRLRNIAALERALMSQELIIALNVPEMYHTLDEYGQVNGFTFTHRGEIRECSF